MIRVADNEEIVFALRELFPKMTEHEGKILWGNVINKDVYMPDGRDAGGTFRRWGEIISLVTEVGDYINYYCSYQLVKMVAGATDSMDEFLETERELLKTLDEADWKIGEMTPYQSSEHSPGSSRNEKDRD